MEILLPSIRNPSTRQSSEIPQVKDSGLLHACQRSIQHKQGLGPGGGTTKDDNSSLSKTNQR